MFRCCFIIKKLPLINRSPHTNRLGSHLYKFVNSNAKGQSVVEHTQKKIHLIEVKIQGDPRTTQPKQSEVAKKRKLL